MRKVYCQSCGAFIEEKTTAGRDKTLCNKCVMAKMAKNEQAYNSYYYMTVTKEKRMGNKPNQDGILSRRIQQKIKQLETATTKAQKEMEANSVALNILKGLVG